MKYIQNKFKKFNKWYDNIPEPTRFLIGFGLLIPYYICLYLHTPYFVFMGFLYVFILIGVRWTKY